MARDFKFAPGHKFGEAVRAAKAGARGDRTMRGEAKPKTDMEGMEKGEVGGSAGNRPGKASHKSGTGKHDAHKIKGKVRDVHASAVHGGHRVNISYHGKKGARGMGFGGSEEHFHADKEAAKQHVMDAMDNMEPEQADSSDLAQQM